MKTWQDKAHSIIYSECQREYLKANLLPNGRMRKKHVPYSSPELADTLRDCINNNDEEMAKFIFLRLNLPSLKK
jgi:hypothetical protein